MFRLDCHGEIKEVALRLSLLQLLDDAILNILQENKRIRFLAVLVNLPDEGCEAGKFLEVDGSVGEVVGHAIVEEGEVREVDAKVGDARGVLRVERLAVALPVVLVGHDVLQLLVRGGQLTVHRPPGLAQAKHGRRLQSRDDPHRGIEVLILARACGNDYPPLEVLYALFRVQLHNNRPGHVVGEVVELRDEGHDPGGCDILLVLIPLLVQEFTQRDLLVHLLLHQAELARVLRRVNVQELKAPLDPHGRRDLLGKVEALPLRVRALLELLHHRLAQ
mmetsp:Transcript_32501/g.91004  ORF Transcript_32501/g.91004 Transcript_32501/m.91004 type:complete len:277 (-) Transcript_32501:409-1239(-)